MSREDLTSAMDEIGYTLISEDLISLPNGKALQRTDFKKRI